MTFSRDLHYRIGLSVRFSFTIVRLQASILCVQVPQSVLSHPLPPETKKLETMAIGDNYLQKACFAVAIVGVAVAILATALRFVATKRSARQVGWEDWFAVLATLFYIFYVVPFFYCKFISHYIAILSQQYH